MAILAVFYALAEAFSRSRPSTWPGAGTWVEAFAWMALTLVASARSWSTLFDAPAAEQRALERAFLLGQLGKYVPGGIWQALGQVALTVEAGVPLPRAVAGFPVLAVVVAMAGFGVAGALSLLDAPWPWTLACLVGPSLALLLHRRWLAALFAFARKITPKLPAAGDVPSQRALRRSYGWTVLAFLANGLTFAALLRGLHPDAPMLASTGAFAAAWVIGFLAVPFPSGVGIREGALVGLLSVSGVPSAPVLAASVAHRLIAIVTEIGAAAVYYAAPGRNRR